MVTDPTVPPEEIGAALSSYQGYMAIAHVLLRDPPPDNAIHFLRAITRIGLDRPPREAWARLLQRDALRCLERLGLEPMSSAELQADVEAQAQILAQAAGLEGPKAP